MSIPRQEILHRLHAQVAAGKPIVGCGAGTGISAKCAEAGGADIIIIYNSGRYRMAGRGSLAGLMPYGNANQIVKEMGEREVLPVVQETPVIAGVMGTRIDSFSAARAALEFLATAGMKPTSSRDTVSTASYRVGMRLVRVFAILILQRRG